MAPANPTNVDVEYIAIGASLDRTGEMLIKPYPLVPTVTSCLTNPVTLKLSGDGKAGIHASFAPGANGSAIAEANLNAHLLSKAPPVDLAAGRLATAGGKNFLGLDNLTTGDLRPLFLVCLFCFFVF